MFALKNSSDELLVFYDVPKMPAQQLKNFLLIT